MIYEIVRTHTQLQTLAWTPALLVASLFVVVVTWYPFRQAIKIPAKNRQATQWMCIGIWVSWVGRAADSMWWFVPWSMAYINHPAWQSYNDAGVFVNLVFRQGFATYAAYCHIKAFSIPQEDANHYIHRFNIVFIITIALGEFYPLMLKLLYLS